MRNTILIVLVAVAAPAAFGREVQNVPDIRQAIGGQQVLVDGVEKIATPAGRTFQPFKEPVTAAKIQRSIADVVAYLKSHQAPDGSIQDEGYTALGALTMLAAGASPTTDDSLRRALEWLLGRQQNRTDNTYVRGICANVWEYALRKAPYDERLKVALKQEYDWLMKALAAKEGWRYSMSSTDWDNSVTQYGVLGMWAAARAGIDPGGEFWRRMSAHFRRVQNADGGWGYTEGAGSTPNMATAGLATMFLVFDNYHGKGCYTSEKPDVFSTGEAADCLKSITRGMEWLGKRGGSNNEGYYLYGIERTGVASGRRTFGGRDWFADGVIAALQSQQPHGGFSLGGHGGPLGNAAFAALFMVYGGAPTAYSKLEYGSGQDWNLNPRDLANVAKHLWSAYERPLNWASVSIASPASAFEAPILFISGSRALAFSDDEAATLRSYAEAGGTILLEATEGSKPFADSIGKFLRQMYPESAYPACRLEALPDDHPVFTVIKQDWKQRPRLRGASDGSRTFFFVSDGYLSADWQMDETDSDAFKFAMNLLFYSTDRVELEGRFATRLPDTDPAAPRATTVTVARVRHGESGTAPMDWSAGPGAWQRFAAYLKHLNGVELAEKPAVRLGRDSLDGIRFLHLTGRGTLSLAPEESAALKAFVTGGGTVLVDAFGGSATFAASARKQVETVFGAMAPLDSSSMLASGLFAGGADLSKGIRYTLAARRDMRRTEQSAKSQRLDVVMAGRRPAVIFSPVDLTAALAGVNIYGGMGYRPDSAFRVMGNIFALATAD
jgi:hypothetical protein